MLYEAIGLERENCKSRQCIDLVTDVDTNIIYTEMFAVVTLDNTFTTWIPML